MNPYDWIQLDPVTVTIKHSYDPIVYDEAREEVVVVGSFTDGSFLPTGNSTWIWDGRDWLGPSLSVVPDFTGAKMWGLAYDRIRENSVFFGGWTSSFADPGEFRDTTWLWDGTAWTNPTPTHKPSARGGVMMAWSPPNDAVLLYGGFDATAPDTPRYYDDTWLWDGTDWTQVFPSTTPQNGTPTYSLNPITTFRDGVLLTVPFVPYKNWFWDGTDWNMISSSHPNAGTTGSRSGPAFTYDEDRDLAILFGGGTTGIAGGDVAGNNDTWVFDGTTWTQEFPAHQPSTRMGPCMVYDKGPGRKVVTMTGGFRNAIGAGMQDVWVYKGPLHLEGAREINLNP